MNIKTKTKNSRFPVAYWQREHYFRMLNTQERKLVCSRDIDAFVAGAAKRKHAGYNDPKFVEARAAIAAAEKRVTPEAKRGSAIRRAFRALNPRAVNDLNRRKRR